MGVRPERKKIPHSESCRLRRGENAVDVVNQLLAAVVDDVVERHYSTDFLMSMGNLSKTNSKTASAEERASFATDSVGKKESS